ncbi:MerR family transcriptional regulator [Rubrobacter marinus]|uniref:MerR family transcriptional regulator n=1 Tax=Rubrobacter marinus TaxID=2653852 RepID=UPI00140B1698|nr:MerR family transcriptional regulator [Rubrobacter marinus]
MEGKKGGLYRIGEVSRLSGVSVKTIRHYSDEGVLPPSGVTGAGYRMYSEADRSRLELVRTLRAAGFDLATIRRLLEGDVEPLEALRLQAEAVDLQLKTLTRRRALLQATLGADGGPDTSYPDRARALGLLEAREREAFLAEHLRRGLDGVPMDPDAEAWFWRRIVSGMPDELDEERLEAWAELARLASDDTFVEAIRKQTKPVWEAAEGSLDSAGWSGAVRGAIDEAARAVREGRPPTGEREQRVVAGWVEASARAMGKRDDPRFAGWMLSHHEGTYDPRMERYWELISTLKRWEYDPTVSKAYRWLIEGLRWRVAGSQRTDGDGSIAPD